MHRRVLFTVISGLAVLRVRGEDSYSALFNC